MAWQVVERVPVAVADIRLPERDGIGQDTSSRKWYAIRVASNFEKPAAQALQARGIEHFLPLYSRLPERPGGHPRKAEVPLFPGYIFGHFDISRRLPVLTIPGVVHIVGFGKVAVPVDADELDAIRRILDSRLHVEPWPFLKAGERVSIERGPLRGLEGIVLQFKGTYRLVASVTLMQRSIAAEIDRESVRPLPDAFSSKRAGTPAQAVAG